MFGRMNRKESLIAHLEAMTAYARLSQIARDMDGPCLVISASDDPLVTRDAAERLAKLCNGRHKQMIGIGHTIPVEAPELFATTVLGFLSENQQVPIHEYRFTKAGPFEGHCQVFVQKW